MDDVPDLVYHYTTAPGLFGIISEHQIRATHVRYLNDLSESTYANDIFYEFAHPWLDNTIEKASEYDESSSPRDILADVIIRTYIDLKDRYDFFVISFCENRDLLSQWRGYGSSSGYAIGFDRPGLSSIGDKHLGFKKVTYCRERQQELLKTAMPIWVDAGNTAVQFRLRRIHSSIHRCVDRIDLVQVGGF